MEGALNSTHVHNDQMIAPQQEGDFMHHTKNFKPHAAGHKLAAEHVKSMCGGGMAKGKK